MDAEHCDRHRPADHKIPAVNGKAARPKSRRYLEEHETNNETHHRLVSAPVNRNLPDSGLNIPFTDLGDTQVRADRSNNTGLAVDDTCSTNPPREDSGCIGTGSAVPPPSSDYHNEIKRGRNTFTDGNDNNSIISYGIRPQKNSHSLHEFVGKIEFERERLLSAGIPHDTRHLRILLTKLSYVLESRDMESPKISGEEACAVSRKLGKLKGVLIGILDRRDDRGNHSAVEYEDDEIHESRSTQSPVHERAILARLAIQVSGTNRLAAEVELAAAEAELMAESTQNDQLQSDDGIDSANEESEVSEIQSGEDTPENEEPVDEARVEACADTKEVEGVGGETVEMSILSKGDGELGSMEGETMKIEGDEQANATENGGTEEEGVQSRSSSRSSRPSSSVNRSASRLSVNDNRGENSGESLNNGGGVSVPSSRPISSRSITESRVSSTASGSQKSKGVNSPRPSSSRSSQKSTSEKPLDWPHYTLQLSDRIAGSAETIGCVIRSTDDVTRDGDDIFTCHSANHLSTSILEENEELLSDIIAVEEVTSEKDGVTMEESEGINGGEQGVDTDDEVEEESGTDREDAGDEEKAMEDNNGGERGGNDQRKDVAREGVGEEKTIEDGQEISGGVDQVPQNVQKQSPPPREYRLVVGIPYTVTPRMASTREIIVKRRDTGDTWSALQPLSVDSSFQEHKSPFAEVRVNRTGIFAVVARPLTDRVTITKKGGSLKSSIDGRISVTYPEGVSSLMTAALRVQPAEQAVSELKSRMRHCSDLIAASPILHLTHSTKKPFERPVIVSLSCPPNPHKASAAAAAIRADGPDEKTPKPTVLPARDDVVIIRSTKSSILGANPEEDALHILHRSMISNSWVELAETDIAEIRKDVVQFEVTRPYHRLLILRMAADGRYPVENVAFSFEQALQIKYCKMILAHKAEDLESALVACVPVRQVEGMLRKLAADGYEAPSEMSDELPLTEGMQIEMRATGNIRVISHETAKMIFHSQRRNALDLRLDYENKYGNYGSTDYRGSLAFYGIPGIQLTDMEDPEEILLREAEANVEAKKRGKQKDKRETEIKEQVRNVMNKPDDLLCKLPVSLPKRSSDIDLTKTTHSRSKVADVPGVTCNSNIRWLATELGNEWESLVSYLGVESNRLQGVKRNFRGNREAQIFNALVTWRSRLPKLYDKDHRLLRALTKCGRYDLAEELKYRETDQENRGSGEDYKQEVTSEENRIDEE